MENEKRSDDQEQLESHSLPGTNQAGREAAKCEEDEQEKGTAGKDDSDKERSGRPT